MDVVELELPGLKLLKPRVFGDERGFFVETYHRERYRSAGIECDFVQDNHSRSRYGVLRGLHYQCHPGQAKLVCVGSGRIFDVAVDLRLDSPTFGRWSGQFLDDREHHQMFVPVGFAHGFCVMSEMASVLYKVSAPYDAKAECTLSWSDPEIGVRWPIAEPTLSERDLRGMSFAQYVAEAKR